jgi:hypothetical protein
MLCRTPEDAQDVARAWIKEEGEDPWGRVVAVYRAEPEMASERVWRTVRYAPLAEVDDGE